MATSEFTFKLKDNAKEYPARFGGHEVKLTLPTSLDGVRGMVQDGVDQDEVLLGLITGQGLRLTKQKKVKDVLGAETYKDRHGKEHTIKELGIPEALELARDEAESMILGAPRVRTGGKKSRAVQEAEAKVDSAKDALRSTYLAVPKNVRKQLREDLLNRGVFTEAELAEMDAA